MLHVCVMRTFLIYSYIPSFTKVQFVNEVKAANAGKSNIKRAFPDGPKKVTAVFLDVLPSALQDKLKGGIISVFIGTARVII